MNVRGIGATHVSAFIVCAVVALELLSLLLVGGFSAEPTPLSAAASAGPSEAAGGLAATQLSLASASLGQGSGPADGVPVSCSGGGTAAASVWCGGSSPLPGGPIAGPITSPSWKLVTAPTPSVLELATMVYDVRDGYVVLFGGFTGAAFLGQTWKFSASTWTLLHPSVSPPARAG